MKALVICLCVILFLLTFGTILSPATFVEVRASSSTSLQPATLYVTIFQIDPSRLLATVKIEVDVYTNQVLYNNTMVEVGGSGYAYFAIHPGGGSAVEGRLNDYHGNSGIVLWGMYGFGEAYPFDRYWMNFSLSPLYNPYLTTANITLSNHSSAFFAGNYTLALSSTWRTINDSNVPINFILPGSNSLVVELDRQTRSGIPLLATILSTYAMIGFSLLIDSKRLSERLTVYTAVFVMILGFYFGIGNLLPYHSGYSIVEVLFLGLIICTSIFSCLSMTFRGQDNSRRSKSPRPTEEAIALIMAGIVLLALPRFGLYPILIADWQIGTRDPVVLYAIAIGLLIGPGLFGVSRNSKKTAIGSILTIVVFWALVFITDQLYYYLLFFIVLLVIVSITSLERRGRWSRTKSRRHSPAYRDKP